MRMLGGLLLLVTACSTITARPVTFDAPVGCCCAYGDCRERLTQEETGTRPAIARDAGGSRRFGHDGRGKTEGERRPRAVVSLRPQAAAVGLDDRAADREAETHAVRLRRVERVE